MNSKSQKRKPSQKRKLSQNQYVKQGGSCCPFCGSIAIDGGNFEVDFGVGYQHIHCVECEKNWTDYYNIVGYKESF